MRTAGARKLARMRCSIKQVFSASYNAARSFEACRPKVWKNSTRCSVGMVSTVAAWASALKLVRLQRGIARVFGQFEQLALKFLECARQRVIGVATRDGESRIEQRACARRQVRARGETKRIGRGGARLACFFKSLVHD